VSLCGDYNRARIRIEGADRVAELLIGESIELRQQRLSRVESPNRGVIRAHPRGDAFEQPAIGAAVRRARAGVAEDAGGEGAARIRGERDFRQFRAVLELLDVMDRFVGLVDRMTPFVRDD
jgi:hypothetical protein